MSITFYPNYIHNAGFSKTAEPSITGETYVCSGAETSGAAYDLVDNRRSNLVTIATNGETTSPIIDFDLTADITGATFCIVDNHNFNTANASVSFRDAGVEVDPSSAYSGALGAELTEETTGSNYVITPTDGILLIVLPATTDNNLELIIIDHLAGNFNADITIGEVAIGVSCTPTISPDVNQPEIITYGNIINQSGGGQKYGVQRFGKRRKWTLGWKIIQSTDLTNLKAVWDACQGSLYPFWIDLGEGTSNPLLYFVRFVGDFNATKLTHQAYSLKLVIEEEI